MPLLASSSTSAVVTLSPLCVRVLVLIADIDARRAIRLVTSGVERVTIGAIERIGRCVGDVRHVRRSDASSRIYEWKNKNKQSEL